MLPRSGPAHNFVARPTWPCAAVPRGFRAQPELNERSDLSPRPEILVGPTKLAALGPVGRSTGQVAEYRDHGQGARATARLDDCRQQETSRISFRGAPASRYTGGMGTANIHPAELRRRSR